MDIKVGRYLSLVIEFKCFVLTSRIIYEALDPWYATSPYVQYLPVRYGNRS